MCNHQDFSQSAQKQSHLNLSIGIWFVKGGSGEGLCPSFALLAFGLGEGLQDVSQLSGWIIGSPKYTRLSVGGGLHGGFGPHQMRHNPAYSWTDKTTSHLMLGLGKALGWVTIWDNLEVITGVQESVFHLQFCPVFQGYIYKTKQVICKKVFSMTMRLLS